MYILRSNKENVTAATEAATKKVAMTIATEATTKSRNEN
jgi:hypothetical protein